ncbi:MAG: tetratricopeptide repeat protein [Deltaproteobacteria bacterium]|nr:tetratricopeptide repeat protein [Deltaproteobacteria bacterium]
MRSPSKPFVTSLSKHGTALLVALALSGAAGCWTSSSQGDRMDRAIADHRRRLTSLETGIAGERQQLREQLEQTSKILKRNSADVGVRVDQLEQQIARLQGSIEELQHGNEELRRELATARQEIARQLERVGRTPAQPTTPTEPTAQVPADRTEHFAAGYRAFQARDFPTAQTLFRAYVQRYPQDDQADNAQYYVGASVLQQNRPAAALGELNQVIQRWPRGDAVDEALFDMGEAFFRLGSCADARQTFQTILDRYPDSPLAARARTRLAEVRRAPRTQCTAQ